AALGGVILPIIPIYGEQELTFILRDSRAKVLFVPSMWRRIDFAARIAKLGNTPDLKAIVAVGEQPLAGSLRWETFVERGADGAASSGDPMDPAFMVYTSGTTASPKGVRHHSNSLVSEIIASARNSGVERRVLSPYPSGHVAGALSILGHAIGGRPT